MSLENNNIEYIKKQYLCCVPINKFRFTESNGVLAEPIDYESQIKIFENTIEDSVSVKYPPRLSYRKAFLRTLIEKSEKDGEEVYVKLYETLINYMTLNDDGNSTYYCHFSLKHDGNVDHVVLQESKNLISEGTTGLRTWQAGFALAEWCNANKKIISEKVVLELGSGVGLTGLSVILTCSPRLYTFSDCHTSVLDMIVKNVRLNFDDNEETSIESFRSVDWNEDCYRTTYRNTDVRIKSLLWSTISDENNVETNLDVVLASDVIYDESIFDELIKALRILITRSNGLLVIVATTVRNDQTLLAFFNKLDIYGLSYEDETLPRYNLFLQLDETPVRILKIFNKE